MNQFLPPFDHPLMSGSSHTFWRCLWWPIHRCRRRRVPLECAMTAAWGNEHNANRTRIEYFSNARRMYTLYPDVNVHMSKPYSSAATRFHFLKLYIICLFMHERKRVNPLRRFQISPGHNRRLCSFLIYPNYFASFVKRASGLEVVMKHWNTHVCVDVARLNQRVMNTRAKHFLRIQIAGGATFSKRFYSTYFFFSDETNISKLETNFLV